jgi:hypothetical protein
MCDTVPKRDWNDPEWVRTYRREKARERLGGLKRHPNILDDGRRWADVYPHGGFATIEEKRKAWRDRYYVKSPQKTCEVCNVEYYTSQEEKHMNSKKHKHAQHVYETLKEKLRLT